MTNTPTYTGDLLLSINTDNDWDINYITGQPEMTDGFETQDMLAVFGEPDFWQNDLTTDPNEKYISDFPAVIRNGRVDDKTLKAGTAAIKKALQFKITTGQAESIEVTGSVISVFGLSWEIEIIKGVVISLYTINWQKGVIDVAGIPIFEARPIPEFIHFPKAIPTGQTKILPTGQTKLAIIGA